MMRQCCLVFGLCILMSVAAYAQDLGPVITVTDDVGPQQFPDVAYNSADDSFLVVWENALAERVFMIEGVLLDGSSGEPIGEPQIFLDAEGGYEAPAVVYNSADNEFVVMARRIINQNATVVRVSAQGELLGDPIELGSAGGPTFFDPAARARVAAMAYNAADNQYLAALGGPMTAQTLFSDLSLDFPLDQFGNGTNPAAAWSSQSNVYLVAFEDRESRDTGAENLSAQLIAANGDLIGETIRVRDQAFAEESPRVAYNPLDEEFLVIWDERIGFDEDADPQTLTDVIGYRITPQGELLGEPIGIEQDTAYSLRQDIDFNALNEKYLVVFKGDESGNFAFADILGRVIGRSGALEMPLFEIYDSGDNEDEDLQSERYFDESKLPVVEAREGSGAFLVVWEEAGLEGDPEQRNILARFVNLPVDTVTCDWPMYE